VAEDGDLAERPDPGGPGAEAVEAAAFVLSLRALGMRDKAVLGAMERVPRDLFAPRRYRDLARSDVALPLPCGQTMTAPSVVATMLTALGLKAGQTVLEVGTGSGYVTALLHRMGAAELSTVERYATLAEEAAARFEVAGLDGVRAEVGDGLADGEGEVDRVLVNGTLTELPAALAARLAPTGRLVAALLTGGLPRLLVLERDPATGLLRQRLEGNLRLPRLAAGRALAL
jgi:protein-L-isoaspartate(D-aspartate) O-methyltransferase